MWSRILSIKPSEIRKTLRAYEAKQKEKKSINSSYTLQIIP